MDGPTVPVCMREHAGIFSMEITFDAEQAIGKLNELTKVQLPRASYTALNKALFQTREDFKQTSQSIFSQTVPFTRNAVLNLFSVKLFHLHAMQFCTTGLNKLAMNCKQEFICVTLRQKEMLLQII